MKPHMLIALPVSQTTVSPIVHTPYYFYEDI
ncbi:MAG: hypothetical protein QOG85_2469 [Gaiellaceae bacterium]|jgi:hypothetical protein|nr:hypothetical protein [Gaiellaceae bacterium]